jgi:muconolactone delta-isomerase
VIEMQFLVIAEARDTIVGDDVRRLRKDVATAIQRIQDSGKLQAGGVLAGRRRPFLLLEADSADELLELLGSEMIDNFNCDVHPVVSFDVLKKFFAEHPV